MTDNTPIRKLNVGAIGGGTLAVLVTMVARRAGLDLTPEEAVALASVVGAALTWVIGYFTPDPRVIGSSHPDAPAR